MLLDAGVGGRAPSPGSARNGTSTLLRPPAATRASSHRSSPTCGSGASHSSRSATSPISCRSACKRIGLNTCSCTWSPASSAVDFRLFLYTHARAPPCAPAVDDPCARPAAVREGHSSLRARRPRGARDAVVALAIRNCSGGSASGTGGLRKGSAPILSAHAAAASFRSPRAPRARSTLATAGRSGHLVGAVGSASRCAGAADWPRRDSSRFPTNTSSPRWLASPELTKTEAPRQP